MLFCSGYHVWKLCGFLVYKREVFTIERVLMHTVMKVALGTSIVIVCYKGVHHSVLPVKRASIVIHTNMWLDLQKKPLFFLIDNS